MSLTSKLKISDPSRLVDGLTQEKLDKDPALLEFMHSNFPDAFEFDDEQEDPVYEQMRAMGYRTDQPNSYEGKKSKAEKEADVGYARNIRPLTTYVRSRLEEEGSHNSTKLRNQHNLIPGLLYGSDPTLGIRANAEISVKTPWDSIKAEINRYKLGFESRVYHLTIKEHPDDEDGTVHLVTPRGIQRHPIKETIYCCNFLRYHPGRILEIPYRYINTEDSPALKRDGFIVPITRKVEVLVEEGVDIPEAIDVECTGVKFREVLRTDRLILPDGVRLSKRILKRNERGDRDRRWIVGVVFGGSRGKNLEDDDDEKKDTAAAAPTTTDVAAAKEK